jgi:hypothetical protein
VLEIGELAMGTINAKALNAELTLALARVRAS